MTDDPRSNTGLSRAVVSFLHSRGGSFFYISFLFICHSWVMTVIFCSMTWEMTPRASTVTILALLVIFWYQRTIMIKCYCFVKGVAYGNSWIRGLHHFQPCSPIGSRKARKRGRARVSAKSKHEGSLPELSSIVRRARSRSLALVVGRMAFMLNLHLMVASIAKQRLRLTGWLAGWLGPAIHPQWTILNWHNLTF